MLYYAYQAQCDALAPLRLVAETARNLIDNRWSLPWPFTGDLPMVRDAAAALELWSHTRISHEHPAFGIDRVTIDGSEVAVSEQTVADHPFCRLVHFRTAAAPDTFCSSAKIP